MPEGDTIFRAARSLRETLEGRVVVAVATTAPRVRALGAQRLVGQTVTAVQPRGKHLLIWFSPGDLALHTHMRMTGSWHVYRPGQRWRRPERLATLVLSVEGWTAVCFSAPVCELLSRAQVECHRALAALGPDALDDRTDLPEARRRLDARAGWTVGEALLDQRVLAGVGNVYKSEVLFLHAVDPWARVDEVAEEVRDALLATAERLLKANVRAGGSPIRVTTANPGAGGPRLHVYGRARRPCLRCSTPIAVAGQGEQARLTYWCPRCQGPGPHRRGAAAPAARR